MNQKLEVEPNAIVKIHNNFYVAKQTYKCNCYSCALSDNDYACKKVECRPTFRKDKKRVIFERLVD